MSVQIILVFDGLNRSYTLSGDLADVLREDTTLAADSRFKQKPRLEVEAGVAAPSGKRFYEIHGASAQEVLAAAATMLGLPNFDPPPGP